MQRLAVDEIIDHFVAAVNRAAKQRIREEDIPLPLREGAARFGLYYSWTIRRDSAIHWITPLEARLPAPLPASYRSLVTRYLFPAFELSSVVLLGNTGHSLYNELSSVIFHEQSAAKVLLNAGYVQFARQNSGDFDPVCFDTHAKNADGEYPLVQVSYQQTLLEQKPAVVGVIAPSFMSLVEDYLQRDLPSNSRGAALRQE